MQVSNQDGQFGPDRIWGTVFIVLYGLMLLVALLIIFGASAILAVAGQQGTKGAGQIVFPLFGAAFAAIAGLIVLISLGAHVVGAVGIHRSRAWGFWATIALSVVSLGSSGGATCLTVVPLIYSIMRLAGAYRPKPM